MTVRLTDHENGAAAEPGTVSDFPFSFALPCFTSPSDPTVGSSCGVTTSANAVAAGAVKTGRREIWELQQISAMDGGPDGSAATPGDNAPFATQGVFVP